MIIQMSFQGRARVLPYARLAWAPLGACLTQTIVGHATSSGIKIDSIDINVEGDL